MSSAASTSLLLVEDDGNLATLLVRALTDEGYDVTSAADGQRGLHLALTRPFDVMVVDRGLPAIEGLALVARLRGQGVATPMLVLSARGTTQDRVDGLDAGAEDYLATRPQQVFSRQDLLGRVFDEAESENVVDTYVHYCRRKLGRAVISTVRGTGYRLGKT
jgi:DNA-binding response OmpR family regulator